MRYKFRSFLILTGILLFMVVGYAAVSVTFKFEGIAQVGSNEDDFKVSFTKAVLDGEDVTTTVVSTNGLQLKYKNGTLKLAGEKSVMEFAITNNSKQYDAKFQVTCDNLKTENVELELVIEEDKKRINAGENVIGSVTVALNEDYPGEAEETYQEDISCHLKLVALERTEAGDEAIELDENRYKETILNGADPVLSKSLIPVTIDETGKVTYANINSRWYKYAEKEWANAVILKDSAKSMYNVGNVIKEEDIESYFVWIPRYKYKLWNVNTSDELVLAAGDTTPQSIDIMFETKRDTPSYGTKNDEWITHPAFVSLNVNGLWVGKFESGYDGASSVSDIDLDNLTSSNIVIKPNTVSLSTNKTLKFVFDLAYNYRRAIDSHMMKNTEWGAVAYLSHSRFGINGEIRVNNNNNSITGYAAVEEPTCYSNTSTCNKYGNGSDITQPYNSEVGYKASTTGNITGVYDMSGGNFEMVASYSGSGRTNMSSTFAKENEKYIDIYESSDKNQYSHRKLGDATGEMGPFYKSTEGVLSSAFESSWYRDAAFFIHNSDYWTVLYRGGNYDYGVKAGQFAFVSHDGSSLKSSFRVVLAPK